MNSPTFLKPHAATGKKVFVVGLDCAEPTLVFEKWRDKLPNLNQLARNGFWGELESSIPAITVPAWSSMLSSHDPGTLGIYGFRNRADYSYANFKIATASAVRSQRVWDILSHWRKRSVVIGVPQTYPVKPLNGVMISGFLTPGRDCKFAYPFGFEKQVLRLAPEYQFDVPQFRTHNKDWLLDQIYQMTRQRFKVVDYLLRNTDWDFFMVMEIGVDRIHHGFWSFHDPSHRNYRQGNPYETAILEYYQYIDGKLGEWLNYLDNQATVLVVSDHGAQRMEGGFCLNEWLWRQGYLCFKDDPKPGQIQRFEDLEVDWENTIAWGSGGYYGRIFLNVRGREPQGTVPPENYQAVREELAQKLSAVPDHQGNPMQTKVFFPDRIYRTVNRVAPDLMVYFDDLRWRSVGSLGHGSVYTFENDTGPDECNHRQFGMVIYYNPDNPGSGQPLQGAQLMDIAPTVLSEFDIPIPNHFQGELLIKRRAFPNLQNSQDDPSFVKVNGVEKTRVRKTGSAVDRD
ncbi:MAG: phosphodiesterase [Calditrichaeota bacterium]|nr:MAG: phosphodiesterase [Calditrichota bacterium]